MIESGLKHLKKRFTSYSISKSISARDRELVETWFSWIFAYESEMRAMSKFIMTRGTTKDETIKTMNLVIENSSNPPKSPNAST